MTMAGPTSAKTRRLPSGETSGHNVSFDRELEELPPELRWREWMLRAEAVIFACDQPVSREILARVVGRDCSIDLLIDDLREELRSRPYELVSVAGGWQHRTRSGYADAIRASAAPTRSAAAALSEFEAMVLMAMGYFQPVTRGELSKAFGKEVSRYDRRLAWHWLHCVRAEEPDARRTLHLCDDQALPRRLWHGNVARSARH
jgi:chromosome segregation and condensation protein ScpB